MVNRTELHKILVALCKIYPEGGQNTIEHALERIAPKEVSRLCETLELEAEMIRRDRKYILAQQEASRDVQII